MSDIDNSMKGLNLKEMIQALLENDGQIRTCKSVYALPERKVNLMLLLFVRPDTG